MIITAAELPFVLAATAFIGAVWLALVLAVLAAAEGRPRLVVPAIAIVGVGWLAIATDASAHLPMQLAVLGQLGLAALGVVAGGPVAMLVLAAASHGGATHEGAHGGIIVGDEPGREVLRGGTTIGYLERLVIVAAVLIGRWELLAALIAIKGLGRFRDLDAGAATERFIIGTLVSLLWAGACAGLIVLA